MHSLSELVLPRREERRLLLTRGPGASPGTKHCLVLALRQHPASSGGAAPGDGHRISGAGDARPLSARLTVPSTPTLSGVMSRHQPPAAPRPQHRLSSAAGEHGAGSCTQRSERHCHGGTRGRPPPPRASTEGKDGPGGGELWGRDGEQGRGGWSPGQGWREGGGLGLLPAPQREFSRVIRAGGCESANDA